MQLTDAQLNTLVAFYGEPFAAGGACLALLNRPGRHGRLPAPSLATGSCSCEFLQLGLIVVSFQAT